ncbi:hypothetical protein Tco_0818308 [Tanacetum coccineum]
MNQNFYEPNLCYNSITSGFDQFQPPQFPVIHQPPQEMSIQDMEDLKQQYLDEMKSLINTKDYHNEKIDIEIKINELKENFNGMSIEINKKRNLQQLDDDESFSDEDVPKEIYSNPLFDKEIISTKIDPHHFNAEYDLIEFMLNQDTSINSSPKINSLLEDFSGELAHIDLIPLGINEADFDHEEEIHLVEKLLYENSSPRPPEEFNSENSGAIIESFSLSPILVEDSDSLMEEIDLFLTPDDSMPPGIDNDDYDSEGDILFLEELLSNDSLSLPENESFHFDVPSSRRPPEKPPDDDEIEPDTRLLTAKMVVIDTLLLFSSENEDKVHLLSHHGFKTFPLSSESPMMTHGGDNPILDVPIAPDYEASRARGFVLRSLELQSLA